MVFRKKSAFGLSTRGEMPYLPAMIYYLSRIINAYFCCLQLGFICFLSGCGPTGSSQQLPDEAIFRDEVLESTRELDSPGEITSSTQQTETGPPQPSRDPLLSIEKELRAQNWRLRMGWYIQEGLYLEELFAQARMEGLKESGYRTNIARLSIRQHSQHVLLVGPYYSAEYASEQLSELGNTHGVSTKLPIVFIGR